MYKYVCRDAEDMVYKFVCRHVYGHACEDNEDSVYEHVDRYAHKREYRHVHRHVDMSMGT